MSVNLDAEEQAALLEILEPTGAPQWEKVSGIDDWSLRAAARAIAHDLREPIIGIKRLAGWLAELASDEDREQSERYRALLDERLGRMERRYDALRRFIESGLADGEYREISIGELVSELAAEVGQKEGRAFSLAVTSEEASVSVEVEALRRCLRELVSNAIIHHDGGVVSLAVAVRSRAGAFEIEIEDDGPGLGAAQPEALFEPFAGATGVGMGLAIARRTAALRGGWCAIEGCGPRGARAILTWPR